MTPATAPPSNQARYDELCEVLAGGVSSNMRAAGVAAPIVIAAASGCRIRDVEGNELIDVNMGYGPHIFGYADSEVTAQIADQFRHGHLTGLPHQLDHQAASLVAELVPGIEQCRFANSGTEALMSAVRLARASTGRNLILTFGGHYHGWSETLLRSREPAGAGDRPLPGAAGMIPDALRHTLQVPWNDTAAVRRVHEQHGGELAAIICEPVLANAGVVAPEPGFLDLLRKLTRDSGAMLIFDEVITGFRVALGGGQERYGVIPDLTVVSKAMGGGFPVAAFGGHREAMEPLRTHEAFHAGVYAGNHAAVRAVTAALTKIRSLPELYADLETLGSYAETQVRKAADAAGRPLLVSRVGSVMSVALLDQAVPSRADRAGHRALQIACQRRGVYFHPNPDEPWFLSTAHTAADIDTVAAVLHDGLAAGS